MPNGRNLLLGLSLRHTIVLLAFITTMLLSTTRCYAEISGFGVSGSGWTLNTTRWDGRPFVSNDVLTIMGSARATANSFWCNTKQDITHFTATFTWKSGTPFDGYNPGDGFAFVIHNSQWGHP